MANRTLTTRIVIRNDTATNWTANNTKVLMKGEVGFETDTGKYKIGDGSSTWENLTYYTHLTSGKAGSLDTLIGMLNNDDFGKVDDVKVDNVSIISSKVGNLATINGNYDASSNKLATASDLPTIDSVLDVTSTNPVQNKKIAELVPSQASSINQLADKAFVNSSIATATATFRGTYNVVSDLSLTPSATTSQIATALASEVSTADNNDYCFVQIPTAVGTPTEIARIDRYKYDGTGWSFEYSLNNSGFTSAQWEAINSGITSTLVTKLNGIEAGAQVNTITGVRGNAENSYRTGNVEIDPDDLDDTSSTNKFVTASDKTTWNGLSTSKQNKNVGSANSGKILKVDSNGDIAVSTVVDANIMVDTDTYILNGGSSTTGS